MHALIRCLAASYVMAACGAEKPAVEPQFEIAVRVTSDNNDPVDGVRIIAAGRELGATNSTGELRVQVRGKEGKTLPIRVGCPDGFVSPVAAIPIRLSHTRDVGDERSLPILFDATCTRNAREVVVVVHATVGELPVLVDGKPVTTTDALGNAHVLVRVDGSARAISASLDTSSVSALQPQNPSRVFDLQGRDTVVIFSQTFVTSRDKRRAPKTAARSAPKRHVPYRVD